MRVHLPVLFAAAVVIAAACGGGQPAQAPAPTLPQGPNQDSIRLANQRRLDSLRADSIRRANEQSERMRRAAAADSAAERERIAAEMRNLLMTRIHFDYDKSEVRSGEDSRVLDQKIAIMQMNTNLVISIIGHADDRGSDEYNLALGNRRALAAKKYLTDRGIAADRVATSSMGEEQPADPGSNESAWAANRRGEFSITRGGETLRRPSGM